MNMPSASREFGVTSALNCSSRSLSPSASPSRLTGTAERDNNPRPAEVNDLETAVGGWLTGLKFSRKGGDRLKEKIADSLRIAPAKSPGEVVREIPDAIRYTFCFEPENYTDGYWDVKERLQERGHRMIYSENHWREDPEYKGINTRWVTQEGQRFEVQFHSRESYHAKQEVTHNSYERIRNRLTGRSERRELEAFQREVCAWITAPVEVASVPDYEKRD